MHDLTYARQIISVLKKALVKETIAKPVISATVYVSLSPVSHVSPQRLREVFELLIEGEKLPAVKLAIDVKEIEVFCKRCKKDAKVKEPVVICPSCKSEDIQVNLKEEFVIDSIEVETGA
ncbi:MAG: hydrogenase maturation nickel metallochaperone HypA [Candidatus Omnitrophica bacterium]|nr:hydrogenase maturation nickel metallochaperone HypA [Candidatus Omnitrophota bacterium]